DALEVLRRRLAASTTSPTEVAKGLPQAVQCLQQLNQLDQFDDLVEKTVEVHGGQWQVLLAAAQQYQQIPHYGFLIAGEFERGSHRGGGQIMHATHRDYVRALQLLVKALELAEKSDDPKAASGVAQQLTQ